MNKQKIKQMLVCTLITGTLISATTCIANAKTLSDKKESEDYTVESTESKDCKTTIENIENLNKNNKEEKIESKQSIEVKNEKKQNNKYEKETKKHVKEDVAPQKDLKNKVEIEKKEIIKSNEKNTSFLNSLSEIFGLTSETESEKNKREEELKLKENKLKEEAFKALDLSAKALKEANSEMEEKKVSNLVKLTKEAVSKANDYKKLIEKNKNFTEDATNNAEKFLTEAQAQEELATNLKYSYDLLALVKNIKSNKDVKSFCTKLEELTSKNLDKITLKVISKVKDEYIKEFTKEYTKATSYNEGLLLSTRVSYFIQVLGEDKNHKNAIEKASMNILTTKVKELKKEEKMKDDFISGYTYSIHNLNENECTSSILKTSLSLCDELGNTIIKQIKNKNYNNEAVLKNLIKHLKEGQSTENPMYIEGIKLEKALEKLKPSNKNLTERKEEKNSYFSVATDLYNYSSNIYNEGSKITSDIISTGKTVYTTVTDLYSSAKYIISVANELSDKAKTGMDLISSITGKKEEKPVSFITSISNKAKNAYETAKTIKTAFDYVLKANEILDNITEGNSSQQSSISPFTKKIHTLCSTTRRTVTAVKTYFKVKSAANSAWNSVTGWFN